MTTNYKPPTDREIDLHTVAHVLGVMADLQGVYWDARDIEEFPEMDPTRLPQEIQDGLDKLNKVADLLVYKGAKMLWEYAKDRGLTDDITAMGEAGKLPCRTWDRLYTVVQEMIERGSSDGLWG